jgi:prephenate dehydrogenase
MKPNFAYRNPANSLFERLPGYIEESFIKIKNTNPGTNWSIQNPNMEAQYVYERLTVFRDQLKELEEVAKKPEHHNLINKALIQVDEWQKYLIDTEIINQSKRYFADDILHGSDKNPNLLNGAN